LFDIKIQRPRNWIHDLNLIHRNLLSTTEFEYPSSSFACRFANHSIWFCVYVGKIGVFCPTCWGQSCNGNLSTPYPHTLFLYD